MSLLNDNMNSDSDNLSNDNMDKDDNQTYKTLDLYESKVSPDEMIGMIRLAKKLKYTSLTFNVKIFKSRDQCSKYWTQIELYARVSCLGSTVFINFYEPGKKPGKLCTNNF